MNWWWRTQASDKLEDAVEVKLALTRLKYGFRKARLSWASRPPSTEVEGAKAGGEMYFEVAESK